jgi:hypothetical protein
VTLLARYCPDAVETDAGTPCACGRRCAEADYQGNAALCPRAFCRTDRDWIGRAIVGLPGAYAELALLLPRSGQAGERVSGSREAPIPVAADVEAFMREIVLVACSWEEQVRAVAGLSDYPEVPEAALGWGVAGGGRRDGKALADACRTLGPDAHLDTLLSLEAQEKMRYASPARVADLAESDPGLVLHFDASGDAWELRVMDGTDAGLEFLAVTGRARGMLGLNRQRRRITEIPCDSCGAPTLVQREAPSGGWEEAVRCTNCPNAYTGLSFGHFMGRLYQVQVAALAAEGRRRAAA